MDPFGIAIFCDDVREEVGGKISLIGCYGTDMQFAGATFPVEVPKLGIHVVARLPVDRPTPPLQLLVYFPGDPDEAPILRINFPVPQEIQTNVQDAKWPEPLRSDVDRAHLLRHHFVLSPAVFKEEGFVRVRLMYGDQRIRLGVLKVHAISPTTT